MDKTRRFLAEEPVLEYQAGRVTRREFLRRAALITGGSLVGASLLGNLACGAPAATATQVPAAPSTPGPGETVSPADPRLEAGPVQFPVDGDTISGYLSRPKEPGPHPAVLVIHENRGMLPHFPDVTRRLALEGYAALTIDLLSRQGGTASFADSGQARDALREIPQERFIADLNAGVEYLRDLPQVRPDRVGVTGFCSGGSLTWLLSVRNPNIRAAAPFYGSAPPLEEVPNLSIPVLGIYGAEDDRINRGVPDLEAALKEHGKNYKFITYPGAGHAFFNDTGSRYDPQAAEEAWQELLGWFQTNLKQ